MSDAKAKEIRKLRRQSNAIDYIKKGLHMLQWSMVKVDNNVFLIGHKETALYAKEIIDETLRPEITKPRATGSLELGASQSDDSEASHAGESLPEVPASGVGTDVK